MSVFDPFLSDPNVAAIMRNYDGDRHMQGVALVREHAMLLLADAVKRVPREAPHILAAYRAKGIEPTWELGNDDDAVTFTLALRDFDPTPDELRAAALLRACVAANEAGEVTPLTNMRAGAATRTAQSRRRKGKPASDPDDADRNGRIRAFHARLFANDPHGATSQTATEFGLSTRTIRRILQG